ncbi:E3 ubiquitin-protein ligase HECTD1 [Paragonimus westermani]|uniref:E3 ubiquitin-protein ligase n=1 Tax=Paragonimus westermani TaxID=34504 RepID=A0A5J4NMJ1_9TREM|nr:E3 ubiquitin-protein ligase HECTD1 [Paragonimus westermani]
MHHSHLGGSIGYCRMCRNKLFQLNLPHLTGVHATDGEWQVCGTSDAACINLMDRKTPLTGPLATIVVDLILNLCQGQPNLLFSIAESPALARLFQDALFDYSVDESDAAATKTLNSKSDGLIPMLQLADGLLNLAMTLPCQIGQSQTNPETTQPSTNGAVYTNCELDTGASQNELERVEKHDKLPALVGNQNRIMWENYLKARLVSPGHNDSTAACMRSGLPAPPSLTSSSSSVTSTSGQLDDQILQAAFFVARQAFDHLGISDDAKLASECFHQWLANSLANRANMADILSILQSGQINGCWMDSAGQTLLACSLSTGHGAATLALCNRGVDVNAGVTASAIHYAIAYGQLQCVRRLLGRSLSPDGNQILTEASTANPRLRDYQGRTPTQLGLQALAFAIKRGTEVEQFLSQARLLQEAEDRFKLEVDENLASPFANLLKLTLPVLAEVYMNTARPEIKLRALKLFARSVRSKTGFVVLYQMQKCSETSTTDGNIRTSNSRGTPLCNRLVQTIAHVLSQTSSFQCLYELGQLQAYTMGDWYIMRTDLNSLLLFHEFAILWLEVSSQFSTTTTAAAAAASIASSAAVTAEEATEPAHLVYHTVNAYLITRKEKCTKSDVPVVTPLLPVGRNSSAVSATEDSGQLNKTPSLYCLNSSEAVENLTVLQFRSDSNPIDKSELANDLWRRLLPMIVQIRHMFYGMLPLPISKSAPPTSGLREANRIEQTSRLNSPAETPKLQVPGCSTTTHGHTSDISNTLSPGCLISRTCATSSIVGHQSKDICVIKAMPNLYVVQTDVSESVTPSSAESRQTEQQSGLPCTTKNLNDKFEPGTLTKCSIVADHHRSTNSQLSAESPHDTPLLVANEINADQPGATPQHMGVELPELSSNITSEAILGSPQSRPITSSDLANQHSFAEMTKDEPNKAEQIHTFLGRGAQSESPGYNNGLSASGKVIILRVGPIRLSLSPQGLWILVEPKIDPRVRLQITEGKFLDTCVHPECRSGWNPDCCDDIMDYNRKTVQFLCKTDDLPSQRRRTPKYAVQDLPQTTEIDSSVTVNGGSQGSKCEAIKILCHPTRTGGIRVYGEFDKLVYETGPITRSSGHLRLTRLLENLSFNQRQYVRTKHRENRLKNIQRTIIRVALALSNLLKRVMSKKLISQTQELPSPLFEKHLLKHEPGMVSQLTTCADWFCSADVPTGTEANQRNSSLDFTHLIERLRHATPYEILSSQIIPQMYFLLKIERYRMPLTQFVNLPEQLLTRTIQLRPTLVDHPREETNGTPVPGGSTYCRKVDLSTYHLYVQPLTTVHQLQEWILKTAKKIPWYNDELKHMGFVYDLKHPPNRVCLVPPVGNAFTTEHNRFWGGVFAWLGTNGGRESKWANPLRLHGLVRMTCSDSQLNTDPYTLGVVLANSAITSRRARGMLGTAGTAPHLDDTRSSVWIRPSETGPFTNYSTAWIAFDLGIHIYLTHYMIQVPMLSDHWPELTDWQLQGSTNGLTWTVLSEHHVTLVGHPKFYWGNDGERLWELTSTSCLSGSVELRSWRFFRLQLLPSNGRCGARRITLPRANSLHLRGIEFFGTVTKVFIEPDKVRRAFVISELHYTVTQQRLLLVECIRWNVAELETQNEAYAYLDQFVSGTYVVPEIPLPICDRNSYSSPDKIHHECWPPLNLTEPGTDSQTLHETHNRSSISDSTGILSEPPLLGKVVRNLKDGYVSVQWFTGYTDNLFSFGSQENQVPLLYAMGANQRFDLRVPSEEEVRLRLKLLRESSRVKQDTENPVSSCPTMYEYAENREVNVSTLDTNVKDGQEDLNEYPPNKQSPASNWRDRRTLFAEQVAVDSEEVLKPEARICNEPITGPDITDHCVNLQATPRCDHEIPESIGLPNKMCLIMVKSRSTSACSSTEAHVQEALDITENLLTLPIISGSDDGTQEVEEQAELGCESDDGDDKDEVNQTDEDAETREDQGVVRTNRATAKLNYRLGCEDHFDAPLEAVGRTLELRVLANTKETDLRTSHNFKDDETIPRAPKRAHRRKFAKFDQWERKDPICTHTLIQQCMNLSVVSTSDTAQCVTHSCSNVPDQPGDAAASGCSQLQLDNKSPSTQLLDLLSARMSMSGGGVSNSEPYEQPLREKVTVKTYQCDDTLVLPSVAPAHSARDSKAVPRNRFTNKPISRSQCCEGVKVVTIESNLDGLIPPFETRSGTSHLPSTVNFSIPARILWPPAGLSVVDTPTTRNIGPASSATHVRLWLHQEQTSDAVLNPLDASSFSTLSPTSSGSTFFCSTVPFGPTLPEVPVDPTNAQQMSKFLLDQPEVSLIHYFLRFMDYTEEFLGSGVLRPTRSQLSRTWNQTYLLDYHLESSGSVRNTHGKTVNRQPTFPKTTEPSYPPFDDEGLLGQLLGLIALLYEFTSYQTELPFDLRSNSVSCEWTSVDGLVEKRCDPSPCYVAHISDFGCESCSNQQVTTVPCSTDESPFYSTRLTRKLMLYAHDVWSVLANIHLLSNPDFQVSDCDQGLSWVPRFVTQYKFLFPFEARLEFWHVSSLGASRAIAWLQKQASNARVSSNQQTFLTGMPSFLQRMEASSNTLRDRGGFKSLGCDFSWTPSVLVVPNKDNTRNDWCANMYCDATRKGSAGSWFSSGVPPSSNLSVVTPEIGVGTSGAGFHQPTLASLGRLQRHTARVPRPQTASIRPEQETEIITNSVKQIIVIDRPYTFFIGGNDFWSTAVRLLLAHADKHQELEVEFEGEEGTGLGPTMEFYALLSAELRRHSHGLWVSEDRADRTNQALDLTDDPNENCMPDDWDPVLLTVYPEVDKINATACRTKLPRGEANYDMDLTGIVDDFYVNPPFGLFPAPWPDSQLPPGTELRFYVLGIAVAKCLADQRQMDLPFSNAFLTLLCKVADEDDRYCQNEPVARSSTDWPAGVLDLLHFTEIYPERGKFVGNLIFYLLERGKLKNERSEFDLKAADIDLQKRIFSAELCALCIGMCFPSVTRKFGQYDFPLTEDYEPEMTVRDRSTKQTTDSEELLTSSTAEAYVRRSLEFALNKGIRRQLHAFKAGFERVAPLSSLSMFTPKELGRLISGESCPAWNTSEIWANCEPAAGYNRQSKGFLLLIESLASFDASERRKFLRFVTGCPTLPPGGLRSLHPKLKVAKKDASTCGPYPSVNTCMHYLKLPEYQTVEELKQYLLAAASQPGFYLN